MTPQEAGKILGLAAARDRRTVGEADILAWMEDLDGVTFDEAREALGRHYRTRTDWLMPAHIREHVKVIRNERRPHHEIRALPSRFEADQDAAERARIGAALCRAALRQTTDQGEDLPLDPDDPIRDRALRRARTERKAS